MLIKFSKHTNPIINDNQSSNSNKIFMKNGKIKVNILKHLGRCILTKKLQTQSKHYKLNVNDLFKQ